MDTIKKLGFGLMRLPYQKNAENGDIDENQTKEMIDAYIKNGFTYFDTAWVYHGGHSEEVFGRLVADRYARSQFQVATKMPLWGMKEKSELDRIFSTQLQKCHVSYFDVYLLHALNKGVFETAEKLGAFDFIANMKKQGKIRNIGFSFHDSAEVLDEILTAHPEVDVVQLQINYIDWESNDVQSKKCFEVAAVKHGKKIIVMEPLKGGNLVSLPSEAAKILNDANPALSIASWGIRFAASLENVIVVLSGMSNTEQMSDNMSYMSDFAPLTENEKSALTKTVDVINASIKIPCTACRYCVDGCPKKINIPEFFKLYNQVAQFSLTGPIAWNYGEAKKQGGSPSDCIECGQCENHCPQKIAIISQLKEVARTFEKHA